MRWSIDNKWRFGKIVKGEYCLLRDGHELCWGHDPFEMMKLVDALNEIDAKQEVAA